MQIEHRWNSKLITSINYYMEYSNYRNATLKMKRNRVEKWGEPRESVWMILDPETIFDIHPLYQSTLKMQVHFVFIYNSCWLITHAISYVWETVFSNWLGNLDGRILFLKISNLKIISIESSWNIHQLLIWKHWISIFSTI